MIFNTSYALSKVPHLHRAYVISGCIFFWLAVRMLACATLLVGMVAAVVAAVEAGMPSVHNHFSASFCIDRWLILYPKKDDHLLLRRHRHRLDQL